MIAKKLAYMPKARIRAREEKTEVNSTQKVAKKQHPKSYRKTAPKKLQKRSQFHRALVPLGALASRSVDHLLQWVYSSPSTAARSGQTDNCPNQLRSSP